jgi:hypothetical protein
MAFVLMNDRMDLGSVIPINGWKVAGASALGHYSLLRQLNATLQEPS